MSNFQNEQLAREKQELRKDRRLEKNAALCFDIAKLCIGGMVIGAFVPLFSDGSASAHWLLAFCGVVAATIFIYIGNNLLK